MSMISGLIDELNKSADEWNASNMFELARMCRDAADTIDRLDLALDSKRIAERRVTELLDENAKLRELVDGLRYCAHEAHGLCARVPVGGKRPFTCCPLYDFDSNEYRCEKLMSELGVEVDG